MSLSRWAFRFLCWFVVILIVQPQNRFLFLWPLRIANLAAIIALVLHFFGSLTEHRPLLRWGPATIVSFLVLLFGLFAQYFGALQPNTGWNYDIDLLVKTCLVTMLIEAMAFSVDRVWAFEFVLWAALLWWVKAGVRLSSSGATYMGDRIMGASVSLIENPNGFAYYMAIYIPLFFFFYRQQKNVWMRWASAALALTGVYIVLQTGSRGGFILLLILGATIAPRLAIKERKFLLIGTAAMMILWGAVSKGNIERFKTIHHAISTFFMGESQPAVTVDEKSAIERYYRNKHTWNLIQLYPLGVGILPDQGLFPEAVFFATGKAHIEVLMAGRMMGYPGMALYIAVLMVPCVLGFRIQKQAARIAPDIAEMGWLFKVQAILFMVGGFFSPSPFNYPQMMLMGAASALWLNWTRIVLPALSPASLPASGGGAAG